MTSFLCQCHSGRCHADDGGGTKASCCNEDPPDKLPNSHKFDKKIVDCAASLMYRWFNDEDFGMCRVVRFGATGTGLKEKEPLLFYRYVDDDGGVIEESSSLVEVREWVLNDKSNL